MIPQDIRTTLSCALEDYEWANRGAENTDHIAAARAWLDSQPQMPQVSEIASILQGIINSIQIYHHELAIGGELDEDHMLDLTTHATMLIGQLQRPTPGQEE